VSAVDGRPPAEAEPTLLADGIGCFFPLFHLLDALAGPEAGAAVADTRVDKEVTGSPRADDACDRRGVPSWAPPGGYLGGDAPDVSATNDEVL
jgi:hypothetical protein